MPAPAFLEVRGKIFTNPILLKQVFQLRFGYAHLRDYGGQGALLFNFAPGKNGYKVLHLVINQDMLTSLFNHKP
jgi:hypothetical protein